MLTAAIVGCGSDLPTRPEDLGLVLAKSGGTGDPTVTSANPPSATPDTTLDVAIGGSGFDRGSRVDMALDGVVTEKVHTNSTTYVSSTKLIANITIAPDAVEDLYDVMVTTSRGKRGIGTELFAITAKPNPQTGYARVSLEKLPGASSCEGLGINALGNAVGRCSMRKGSRHAFFWSAGSGSIDLGPGRAADVSDLGSPIVTGWTGDGADSRPVIWEPTSGPNAVALPPFPVDSCQSGQANGINGAGDVVVGSACLVVSGEMRWQAVRWTQEGTDWSDPQPLPLPSGYNSGQAMDISTSGVILGILQPSTTGGNQYFVWFPPYVTAEPLPSGSWVYPVAWAVNDNGDVAGTATDNPGWRSLLWKRNGAGWDPPLDIGDYEAKGINNAGVVVGRTITAGSVQAYVWESGTGRIVLGREQAHDINDAGVVVGYGGDGRAVLWLPPR